ncbi:hypothetical protein [Spongiactinospora sp. TRM90649]|uniref:hypothetical protein n=1 Tax=Spongiactinospora sp. TRM90649 TaxID=3031114 RepID=UPI0023F71D6C|nr:hypothetical protein [Spongiactinospora sp. TRM90649]MDF5756562.1 hypothetical protein [Spongiactinospora sp. TRM90649]
MSAFRIDVHFETTYDLTGLQAHGITQTASGYRLTTTVGGMSRERAVESATAYVKAWCWPLCAIHAIDVMELPEADG